MPLPRLRLDDVEAGSAVDYLRILNRHKGLMVFAAMAGLLAGVLLSLSLTPVYQARTSLEVQDVNQEFMNLKMVSPVSDASGLTGLTDVQTQVKLLQSSALMDRALDMVRRSSPSAFREADSPSLLARDDLGQRVARNLKISVAGTTRIVEIVFDWTDPQIASGFANALAAEYIKQNMEARWQMAQHTSDWLGQQLEETRAKLERSETALQSYARRKQLLYTADKQNVSEDKLHQLDAELSRADADLAVKQSRFEITRTAPVETLPDVLNDSNLRSLQTNLTELRRQEAELAATFKPDYTKVKKVRASIVALEAALNRERAAIVGRISNEYQEAQNRKTLLSSSYSSQVRVVTDDLGKSIQYNMLKREVDTNRQIYEAMLQRVKESGVVSAMRASNIRVIDRAKTPVRPYKPNLPINAGMGLAAGLFGGAMMVVLRARGDRCLRIPGEVGGLLGVPELGAIPNAGRSLRRVRDSGILISRWAGQSVELAASRTEPSAVADSFRAVLASILLSGEKARPHVLVITSASPAEGKTTTASNLAITLAQVYPRVLLIDADVRKPSLHKIFDCENNNGLTDLLTQSVLDDESMAAQVQPTAISHLDLLTGGTGGITADMFFARSSTRLFAWCRKEYDMVVIDTPPMLVMPEARVLGRMADAVVLVARAGRTMREAAQAACQKLVTDGTRVLGVVLNDWNPKCSPQGYYGSYKPYSSHRRDS